MKGGRIKNIIPWLLIAVQLCLLVFFAFNRLVDGDEGFYLSAAREVAEGQTLYADFFYPQMPYLPHIFSVFAGKGFTTLYLTRLASVLMGLLTTGIFYLILKRLTTDKVTINFILALYVFSGMIISWHSVAKTFAWTDLFLIGTFYCLVSFVRSPRLWHPVVAGVLMALAVNTRLVFVPLVVLFLIPFIVVSGRKWGKYALAYIVPMIITAIPGIIYLLRDTRRFMFDNLYFHFMRNPGVEFPQSYYQKLFVIGKLLVNPQIMLLLILVVGAYLYGRKVHANSAGGSIFTSPAGIAGITAGVITIVYFLPNPVLQQYFVQAIPFALIVSVKGVEHYLSAIRRGMAGAFKSKLPAIVTAVYILGIIPYFVVFVGAVREFDGHTDIGNMTRICAAINEYPGDDPILAELPMVSVLANKPVVKGVEFLGFEYPLPLDDSEQRYFRLVLNEDLKRILDNKEVSYYIVVNDPPDELVASTEANYQLQGTYERFKVYRRKS